MKQSVILFLLLWAGATSHVGAQRLRQLLQQTDSVMTERYRRKCCLNGTHVADNDIGSGNHKRPIGHADAVAWCRLAGYGHVAIAHL